METESKTPADKSANPILPKTSHSRIFKIVVILLGELIILIGVFSLGINVGLKKAGFTLAWSQNYSKNFGGRPSSIPAPQDNQFFNAHSLDGTILTLDKNSIIIKDEDSNEKTVIVSAQTTMRQNFQNIKFTDLKIGEEIVVIGDPNPQGQINAKLIRVLN